MRAFITSVQSGSFCLKHTEEIGAAFSAAFLISLRSKNNNINVCEDNGMASKVWNIDVSCPPGCSAKQDLPKNLKVEIVHRFCLQHTDTGPEVLME